VVSWSCGRLNIMTVLSSLQSDASRLATLALLLSYPTPAIAACGARDRAEWRMFTWQIGMRSMACSSAKCCSETGEKSLTGAGGFPNMCHESDSTGLARPSLWSVPHASAIVSDALSASVGGAQVAEYARASGVPRWAFGEEPLHYMFTLGGVRIERRPGTPR